MGGRAGGTGSGFGRGSKRGLPDVDMGVKVSGNPLQTALYNSKLQAKNISKETFQVGPKKWVQAKPNTYGLYVEGKGWVKAKGEQAPITFNRKSYAIEVQKTGFMDYSNIEFVNPVK